MAILITNNGHKIVNTIAERDSISQRFDGMQVLVKDATADAALGSGSARYEWIATANRWAIVWSDAFSSMSFATEVLPLSGGKVTLSNIPASGVVFSCWVRHNTTGELIADVVPTVTLSEVNIGSTSFDGHNLYVSYAYGSMSTQLNAVFATKADLVDGKVPLSQLPSGLGGGSGAVSSVNTMIGDVVLTKGDIGLGNVDNTADIDKPVSAATYIALTDKANKVDTYTRTETNTLLEDKAAVNHTHTSFTTFGVDNVFPTAISSGGVINLTSGSYFKINVSSNVNISIGGAPETGKFGGCVIEFTNAGSYTLGWMNNTYWAGGSPPTLSSNKDLVAIHTVDGGTTWFATLIAKNMQ
jgi:hypothetical protein